MQRKKEKKNKQTDKPGVIALPRRVSDQRGWLIIDCINPSREGIASYQRCTYRRLENAP